MFELPLQSRIKGMWIQVITADFHPIKQQHRHFCAVTTTRFARVVDISNIKTKCLVAAPATHIIDHVFTQMAVLAHVNNEMTG